MRATTSTMKSHPSSFCRHLARSVLLVPLAIASVASATVVTNTNDSGAGSLRNEVAATASGGTVTFDPALTSGGPVTITLTSGEIAIAKNLTITGPGADKLTVSGNNASRIFQCTGGTGLTVRISGLKITQGFANAGFGGGIRFSCNGIMRYCEITGNNATGSGGGGVQVTGASGTFLNCNISDNTAQNQGGAIGWQPSATAQKLTVINCTISGNSAIGDGTGFGIGGGIIMFASTASTAPTATVQNCTFANNVGGGTNGSAIRVEAGNTGSTIDCTLFSNIFANGTPVTPALTTRLSGGGVSATYTSQGYNLSQNAGDGFLTGPGDQVNQNPLLGALALNDGPTRTHELLPGSPAIGASNASLRSADSFDLDGDLDTAELLPVDQRGGLFKRVAGGGMDIGAFEVPQIAAPVLTTLGEVLTGNPAPDGTGADDGTKFDALQRSGYIAQNGTIAFLGNLQIGVGGVTNSNFMAYWKQEPASLLMTRLARQGDNAPETGATAAKFNILPLTPGLNDGGQVTLMASLLQSGASTPPTTASNDLGLWSELGGTGFQILIREDDTIPGLGGPKVDSLGYGCFATAKTSATTGEAAFVVGMKGSSTDTALLRTSVVSGDTTAVGVIARQGLPAPGAGENYAAMDNTVTRSVRMDAAGNAVFAAGLASGKVGIWYQDQATKVVGKSIATGDAAPGTTATFQQIDLPNMGGEGTFAFRGVLNTVGDNAANDKNDGIWKATGAGAPSLILRRGDSNTNRAGLFSATYTGTYPSIKAGNIYNGWLTNANHGAWLGWVDLGGNGISAFPYDGNFTAATDTFGIYTDTSGTMTLLIASGDAAPGMPAGAKFFFIDQPVCGGTEQVAFIATVNGGGVTAGTNDKGIWRTASNGGALSLVLRTGDTMSVNVNGTPTTKTIADVDIPGSGYVDHIWETPVMDATGKLIVFVGFTDGTTTQVLVP